MASAAWPSLPQLAADDHGRSARKSFFGQPVGSDSRSGYRHRPAERIDIGIEMPIFPDRLRQRGGSDHLFQIGCWRAEWPQRCMTIRCRQSLEFGKYCCHLAPTELGRRDSARTTPAHSRHSAVKHPRSDILDHLRRVSRVNRSRNPRTADRHSNVWRENLSRGICPQPRRHALVTIVTPARAPSPLATPKSPEGSGFDRRSGFEHVRKGA